jgi:hypothetical protein
LFLKKANALNIFLKNNLKINLSVDLMKIITTFAIVPESLYAVQYADEKLNEFRRLFRLWNDTEYLENFFVEHKIDLQSAFWRNISINEAVLRTKKEANSLERQLIQIAENGKTDRYDTLSSLFKPLHDSTTRISDFEKNKVKGLRHPNWLRIYAIRLDTNLFVVSGGAIKLTPTMNDRAQLELEKLNITQKYLRGDEGDVLELFELF